MKFPNRGKQRVRHNWLIAQIYQQNSFFPSFLFPTLPSPSPSPSPSIPFFSLFNFYPNKALLSLPPYPYAMLEEMNGNGGMKVSSFGYQKENEGNEIKGKESLHLL